MLHCKVWLGKKIKIKWWIFPWFVVLVYQVGYPIMLRRPQIPIRYDHLTQSLFRSSFLVEYWPTMCPLFYSFAFPSNSTSFWRIIPFQRNWPTIFFMYSHYLQGKSPQTCPNWVFPRMVRGSFSTSSPLWIATGWFPASIDIIPD